jgi:hypothetical protein
LSVPFVSAFANWGNEAFYRLITTGNVQILQANKLSRTCAVLLGPMKESADV